METIHSGYVYLIESNGLYVGSDLITSDRQLEFTPFIIKYLNSNRHNISICFVSCPSPKKDEMAQFIDIKLLAEQLKELKVQYKTHGQSRNRENASIGFFIDFEIIDQEQKKIHEFFNSRFGSDELTNSSRFFVERKTLRMYVRDKDMISFIREIGIFSFHNLFISEYVINSNIIKPIGLKIKEVRI